MAINVKQDSNSTGLRYCQETTIGVLPAAASQFWYPTEPNSYSNFGGQIKTLARNPINATRQNQRGVVVDLDAGGGFNSDVTMTNLMRLMQGFMFASIVEPYDSQKLNSAAVVDITATVTTNVYASAAFGHAGTVLVNSLLFASGFATGVNNGLKIVTAITADTSITCSAGGLATDTAAASNRLQLVGYQFASATLTMTQTGGARPVLSRASGVVDFTTLGILPGQWIYIGGDAANTSFVTAANNGYARVYAVTTTTITLDKTSALAVTDAGTGKTIQIFFGKSIKNATTAGAIVRRSFSLERDIGQLDTANANHQAEYINGAVPNQVTFTVKQADKLVADVDFVGTSYVTRDQTANLLSALAVLAGTAANAPGVITDGGAFNTSSDISRLRLSPYSATVSYPSALFAYVTDFTVVVNNNITPNKAVATLGAFEMSAGQFDVSGKITAYFTDPASVAAVQNNTDVSLDCVFAKANQGFMIDIPFLGLGDGRLSVQQNQPITLPLDLNAAKSTDFGYTLLLGYFPYLPTVAM